MSKDIQEAIERIKRKIVTDTGNIGTTVRVSDLTTVLNYIETLEKENKELNEIKDKKLDKYLHKNQWICKNLAENYIHKSIIEEKIEELDKEISAEDRVKYCSNISEMIEHIKKKDRERFIANIKKDVLQDLLENK